MGKIDNDVLKLSSSGEVSKIQRSFSGVLLPDNKNVPY